jgi:CheY-like chemotaxis protein
MKPLGMNERSLISKRAQRTADVLQGAHILWVDDHPENNTNERNILYSFGMLVDLADSTDKAMSMLKTKKNGRQRYDVIISDMKRVEKGEDKPQAGEELLRRIKEKAEEFNIIDIPVIFYAGGFDRRRGIPPYAFGMTNRPDDLLHYIMDVLERQRG